MKTIFAAVGMLALSMSAPVWAQQPDWSQGGDYYPPSGTTVQQATPQELRQFREGDYYAPGKTTVLHPTPQEQNAFREGGALRPLPAMWLDCSGKFRPRDACTWTQ
jgi:hypothetical protein